MGRFLRVSYFCPVALVNPDAEADKTKVTARCIGNIAQIHSDGTIRIGLIGAGIPGRQWR